MKHGRTDANQQNIVLALRAAGCSVTVTSDLGAGFPDLTVGRNCVTYLLEVKIPGGKLTKKEHEWHDLWRGHVAIVYTIDEALRAVGVIE